MVPVPEAERAVDLLRRTHTGDGADGMPPHVTLIYPFTDDSALVAGRIGEVREVLGGFSAFSFQLAEVLQFDNLPDESHVWLAPQPAHPFVNMIQALESAFPEHPSFGGEYSTIVPHLTVASSQDAMVLRNIERELVDRLPINAVASKALIMEYAEGQWRIRAELLFAPPAIS